MHSKILAAAAGLSIAIASFGAEAMPAGAVAGASASPQITLAGAICGPGFRLGPAGVCRRVRGPVVVRPAVVRPVVVAPRRVRPRCGVHVPGVTIRTPC